MPTVLTEVCLVSECWKLSSAGCARLRLTLLLGITRGRGAVSPQTAAHAGLPPWAGRGRSLRLAQPCYHDFSPSASLRELSGWRCPVIQQACVQLSWAVTVFQSGCIYLSSHQIHTFVLHHLLSFLLIDSKEFVTYCRYEPFVEYLHK